MVVPANEWTMTVAVVAHCRFKAVHTQDEPDHDVRSKQITGGRSLPSVVFLRVLRTLVPRSCDASSTPGLNPLRSIEVVLLGGRWLLQLEMKSFFESMAIITSQHPGRQLRLDFHACAASRSCAPQYECHN